MQLSSLNIQLQFYKSEKSFVVEIADNGVPFEIEKLTCENLGLKPARISTQIIARDRHARFMSELSLINQIKNDYNIVFDYEDIQLIPAKCIVDSRSECDTSITFGGRTFKSTEFCK